MVRILVTGGAGFIGSHLIESLLQQGHSVVCVDNFVTGDKRNVEAFHAQGEFELIEHDMIQPLKVDGDIDQVYSLACPASPIDYKNLPLETLFASSYGTKHALDLAVEKKAKILHASTSEVYGDPLQHPQTEAYFGNVNSIGPRSCYDEGKRYAESLVINYANQYGVETKIVRIFNTYGPRMRKNDGRVIPNFINQALNGEDVTIYGDGYQTRSFCYVSDMINGLLSMMNEKAFSGPVNLGNPEEISIKMLAEYIVKLTNSSSEIVHLPVGEDDPKVRRPDISLAAKTLGFNPTVALKEGIESTIKWFTT
jgi:UDP-glucuronate decarboxylase